MENWKLLDYRSELESESDAPAVPITSPEHLQELLEACRDDFPGLAMLKGPHGEELLIALGQGIGYLLWRNRDDGALAHPRNAAPLIDSPYVTILAEGVGDEVPSDRVVPFDAAVDAAVYFLKERKLTPRLTWQLWDPKTKSWSELLANDDGGASASK